MTIYDPEIAYLIKQEESRQEKTINLIASENYTHAEVLAAMGSVLTNKYAEGYPGKRYYAGCDYVDQIETLAIERCKQLFGVDYANVQPHSGSQANMAVYTALLQPGDTILGMSLSAGGHLTHGHSVNFSGSLYNIIQYGVNPQTEYIDYQLLETLALKHRPKLIIAGASAYSRFIDFDIFSRIAKSINAYFMADIAHIAGLIAAGVHPSPVGYADVITSTTHKTLRGPRGGLIMARKELGEKIDRAVMPGIQGGPCMHIIAGKAVAFKLALQEDFKTYQQQVIKNAFAMAQEFSALGYRIVAGGTDNHLFVVDLSNKNCTGKEAESLLNEAGITVSRSCIPFDTQKPWITSGIRIGTPSITTRGYDVSKSQKIVHIIDKILTNPANVTAHRNVIAELQS